MGRSALYKGLETIRRGTTAQCVQDIFEIHFPNATKVLDATHGAGRFWRWPHSLQVTGVDIDPLLPETIRADYRHLPFKEGSFDVLTFDPPFIFSKGIRRVQGTKRFFKPAEHVAPELRAHSRLALHLPDGPSDLMAHYRRIFEQRTVATQGLIVKGQDLIVQRADWWSYNVMKLAEEMGLGLPVDVLIQQSPAARMRDPRWKHQKHFRRSHCFYFIWKWGPCCEGKGRQPEDRGPKVAVPEVQAVAEGRADGVDV